jgi:guanosine-3',5'-bis(diphosphate) 3'-pyrophosphohydrolase
MTDPNAIVFRAASFAAYAHRHQLRKDGRTPYVAHCFRVAFVVRQVFGVDDPQVIATALLHDVIEDTPHDRDEIVELVGEPVASWVAALTKDMRLPDVEREKVYWSALVASPWQVVVAKLGDVYDNLQDSPSMTLEKRHQNLRRATDYLAALQPTLPAEAVKAFTLTEQLRRIIAAELAVV